MAELADAPDLGSGAARHAGSIPVTRTTASQTPLKSKSDVQKLNVRFFIIALLLRLFRKKQSLLRVLSPCKRGLFTPACALCFLRACRLRRFRSQALYRLRRRFLFLGKRHLALSASQSSLCSVGMVMPTSARFLAPPLPQKGTLASAARLQARSRRLRCATTFLRACRLRRHLALPMGATR